MSGDDLGSSLSGRRAMNSGHHMLPGCLLLSPEGPQGGGGLQQLPRDPRGHSNTQGTSGGPCSHMRGSLSSPSYLVRNPTLAPQLGKTHRHREACTRLLHPWDFLGKSTGLGCHFLLQGIFLTQGSNPGLPHCRQTLYRLSHQGSPR